MKHALIRVDAHRKSEVWESEEYKKDKEDDLEEEQQKETWVGLVELNWDWKAHDPHLVLLKSKQPRFKKIFEMKGAILFCHTEEEMQWK